MPSRLFGAVLTVGLGLLSACSGSSSAGGAACSNDSACLAGQICVNSTCVAGVRNGNGDPDHVGDAAKSDGTSGGDTHHPADGNGSPGDGGGDVDITPPSITIDSPLAYVLTSGVIFISATIKDASGIDASSVKARIDAQYDYEVPLVATGGDVFSASFDTHVLVDMLYPSLEVTAVDKAGNRNTVGLEFALDNTPPIVSLAPTIMRMATLDTTINQFRCSQPFNPLGGSAVQSGQIITPNDLVSEFGVLFYPRVRIEDRGNADDTGGAVVPIAGVDTTTTFLYTLTSTGLNAGHHLLERRNRWPLSYRSGGHPRSRGRPAGSALVKRSSPCPAAGPPTTRRAALLLRSVSTAPRRHHPCRSATLPWPTASRTRIRTHTAGCRRSTSSTSTTRAIAPHAPAVLSISTMCRRAGVRRGRRRR